MANLQNTDPQYGAFPTMIDQSSQYIENVWGRIQNSATGSSPLILSSKISKNEIRKILFADEVKNAIHNGLLQVKPTYDDFGDVIFTPHSIQFHSQAAKIKFEKNYWTKEKERITTFAK